LELLQIAAVGFDGVSRVPFAVGSQIFYKGVQHENKTGKLSSKDTIKLST